MELNRLWLSLKLRKEYSLHSLLCPLNVKFCILCESSYKSDNNSFFQNVWEHGKAVLFSGGVYCAEQRGYNFSVYV